MTKVETGKLPAKIDAAQKDRDRNAALRLFVKAVLDMSWQLAIVVLVPVIGGFELDKQLHTSPWLLVVGFILAMIGTYGVIRRMYAEYGQVSVAQPRTKK